DSERTARAATNAQRELTAVKSAATAAENLVKRERERTGQVITVLDKVTQEATATARKEIVAAHDRAKSAQDGAAKAQQDLAAARSASEKAEERLASARKSVDESADVAKTAVTAAEEEREVANRIKQSIAGVAKSAQEPRPAGTRSQLTKSLEAV